MSFLKDKTNPKNINLFEALLSIDLIVYDGVFNKLDTDLINVTWTNTELWYKTIRLKLIDSDRQLTYPSIAITRKSELINFPYRHMTPTTGLKYLLLKKLVQSPLSRKNGRNVYLPAVWLVTQSDPPIFLKIVYGVYLITNMQQDYNAAVQDILSIFDGGRTYLFRLLNVELRLRRLFNRYGVHIHITSQESQTLNSTLVGTRLFKKQFQLTTLTYLYRNILKVRTKTKINLRIVEGI